MQLTRENPSHSECKKKCKPIPLTPTKTTQVIIIVIVNQVTHSLFNLELKRH